MKTWRPAFLWLGRGLSLGMFALLLTGCRTSRNYQAGDAIVHEERVHFSWLATAPVHYRVKLPKVSLAATREYRFTVRNPPVAPRLTHLFASLPQGDASDAGKKSAAVLPWENAVVALVFTAPDGTLIYSNRFRLGDQPWQFAKGDLKLNPVNHADRIFGWYAWCELPQLTTALGTKTNFDALIAVEQPSLRRGDYLQLRGEETGVFDFSRK